MYFLVSRSIQSYTEPMHVASRLPVLQKLVSIACFGTCIRLISGRDLIRGKRINNPDPSTTNNANERALLDTNVNTKAR